MPAEGNKNVQVPAILVLEDGRVFHGVSFGAEGETIGEIVFHTGMTGYPEDLTDPSYHRQIVVMTAPHIGNTGVNDDDAESHRIWVAGYVVREPSRIVSIWRAQRTLEEELRRKGVVGIALSGTRALTRHLRDKGVMRAAISTVETDPDKLRERVLASPQMVGANLAGEVTTAEPYTVRPPDGVPVRFTVAAVDLGIKAMTPQRLAERGCEVRVLPAHTTAEQILALNPDGVFFSNGPGDPAAADAVVETMRGILDAGTPLLGICFGNQILGRALGLETYPLPFGHRGANHPVRETRTGRVYITSQNHGFAVRAPLGPFGHSLRPRRSELHRPQRRRGGRTAAARPPRAQHPVPPEAASGPHDAADVFDTFVEMMTAHRQARGRARLTCVAQLGVARRDCWRAAPLT